MADEFNVLKLVCQSLEHIGIPYMLTGSFAANFYAVPRMTRDIDIVIEILKPDMDKFYKAFQNEFYVHKDAVTEAIKHQSMFNIIHNNSVFKVDFIIRKNSSYREAEFRRRRQVQFHNIPVWIVSPEDLIISKLAWAKDGGSEMQIKDVKNLLCTLKNIDKDYLKQWIQTLDLNSLYDRVKSYE